MTINVPDRDGLAPLQLPRMGGLNFLIYGILDKVGQQVVAGMGIPTGVS